MIGVTKGKLEGAQRYDSEKGTSRDSTLRWKSIQKEYSVIQNLDDITIPVHAVDDSVFNEKDDNFKQFDTVPIPLTSHM